MTFTLLQFNREKWLAEKLDLPGDWDVGITTIADRAERMRQHILANQLSEVVIAKSDKRGALTARMCFERAYGVPLEAPQEAL